MKKNKIFIIAVILITWIAIGIGCFVLRNKFDYQHPLFFWVLGIIPLLGIHYFFKNRDRSLVNHSSVASFNNVPTSPLVWMRHFLHALSMFALASLVMVMARPQSKTENKKVDKEGIDIVLSMDVSASMLALDFKPNRLESSKKVAESFVEGRPDDRFGVVVYEGESYTLVPLTADHRVVIKAIQEIETGLIEGGTAIGMGLATAVTRLKDSEAKSKVIILLTDGVNNQGQINPEDAAKIAKTYGVRVYTIGIGSNGYAKTPVAMQNGRYIFEKRKVEIDEDVLKKIAKETDGKYFRATNEKKLKDIYKEIDELEKTKFNVTQFSHAEEEFLPFGLAALMFLFLGMVLKNTIFKGV